MDTYTRIRRNRAIVKGSAVIVIIFAIAGAVFGIRSAAEPTVLQAAATTVAMVLPASFALLSLKRRPSLLLTASLPQQSSARRFPSSCRYGCSPEGPGSWRFETDPDHCPNRVGP